MGENKFLKGWLADHNISVEKLSRMADIGISTARRAVHGERLSYGVAAKIMKATGGDVQIEELVSGGVSDEMIPIACISVGENGKVCLKVCANFNFSEDALDDLGMLHGKDAVKNLFDSVMKTLGQDISLEMSRYFGVGIECFDVEPKT